MDTVLPILVETMHSLPDETHHGLSLLLHNMCSSLNTHAVGVILPYLESQHVSLLAKVTILSTMSKLLLTSEILVQTKLISVLCSLVESPDLSPHALQSGRHKMYLLTCDILCDVAPRYSSAFAVESNELKDVITALVHLLDVPNGDAIRQACSALATMARYHPFNEQLSTSNAGPALIVLSSHPQIADAATEILSQNLVEAYETAGQKYRHNLYPGCSKF
ncbi:hypothetical protein B0H19DRAFT_662685 [Mycena capillaripes]|nr:hypothetical protein B0H19DRAFT_662685 [Mycena capillaripes]